MGLLGTEETERPGCGAAGGSSGTARPSCAVAATAPVAAGRLVAAGFDVAASVVTSLPASESFGGVGGVGPLSTTSKTIILLVVVVRKEQLTINQFCSIMLLSPSIFVD